MSRSGYVDEIEDQWQMIRWRGAVASAIRGKRGQAFLKELIDSLNSLPQKRLIKEELQTQDGEVCALGAVGRSRHLDMSTTPVEDNAEGVGNLFGIPHSLAVEIQYLNDEAWQAETPEHRFERMKKWAEAQLAR